MLERVIENWLDNTTERFYQEPFCYILSSEGHTIIHSTRHPAMELGVDIITIAPDATPCAYQLKTGNISLSKWRNEVGSQTDDLVCGQLDHPSVDTTKYHRSYFVTNGRIEEEVSRAIADRNRAWTSQNQPYRRLETIVRGELFEKAKKLGTDLWPSELTDIRTLLEMYLENGEGILPKQKLSSLFESTFQLGKETAPSNNECRRTIASAGLLCAIAVSSYTDKENHVAEIEAWTLYIAYVLALAEKWNLPKKVYKNEFEIATQSLYNTLGNLCAEVKDRTYLVEGNPLTDSYVYKVRMTWLLGLMSIYALWRCIKKEPKNETDDFLRDFCREKRSQLKLWGEAAIPQFLAFFWFFRKIDGTKEPDCLIYKLISKICNLNRPGNNRFLANPYYEVEELLPHHFAPILIPPPVPLKDSFEGQSYALEGLVHLYVRRNWKQAMRSLWPAVTRLQFESFVPNNFCEFYRWRSEIGHNNFDSPTHTQDWEELKTISFESEGTCIPPTTKEHPILLLLFLCVYPHRMNAEIIRWLDTQMKDIPRP
ncbi:MAG: hypothetical protein OXI67_17265 [Candidatus Poribacteria bacterium]|nr:hypothetical protein [Candidatus Poribacteria bacterium]